MPILVPSMVKLPEDAGFSITEYFGKSSVPGSEQFSLAIETIDPGISKARHLHRRTEELYFVLSGEGLVNAGGVDHTLASGAAFFIPIGQPHYLSANGTSPLSVLIVSSPAFDESDYEKC
jgi:mannose-6-phosphate isomerase-like protein (cupin superfamily)